MSYTRDRIECMKLVSVIVPIYNVEKYLKQCLDSIINQSYEKLEIILVDDGSTDDCPCICEEYAENDNRIHVIHKKNAGLGMARNSGLDIATGDFVVYVDSDDWLEKTMVEKLLLAIDCEDADFVVCGYNKQFSNGNLFLSKPCCTTKTVFSHNEIKDMVLYPILGAKPDALNDVEREMCVWTNMYRMSIIKENRLRFVNERQYLSEDLFYNINYIIHVKRAVFIPECLYNYRVNAFSLTNKYRDNRFELLCNLYRFEIDLLDKYDLYEETKQRIQRTFIMKMRNCIRILVNSNNESKEKRFNDLKNILNNEIVCAILNDYPIHKYKMSLQIPTMLMKWRWTSLVWLEQRIRNYLKMKGQHD